MQRGWPLPAAGSYCWRGLLNRRRCPSACLPASLPAQPPAPWPAHPPLHVTVGAMPHSCFKMPCSCAAVALVAARGLKPPFTRADCRAGGGAWGLAGELASWQLLK
jgi:hypothetical protein